VIDRGTFLAGTAAVLLAAPLAAGAQQVPVRVVMLLTGSPAGAMREYVAFTKQLGDLGWIEGQTVVVDRQWADAPETFIRLAGDAVQRSPPSSYQPGRTRRVPRNKRPLRSLSS
jgi:hypothetical protein